MSASSFAAVQAFRGKGVRPSSGRCALGMRNALSSLTYLNPARSEDLSFCVVRPGGVSATQVVDAGSEKHSMHRFSELPQWLKDDYTSLEMGFARSNQGS